MTSDSVKSVDGSDSVKGMEAVSPAMSEETLEEILILGEMELIESISVLSLSEPSSLMFPEGLENEFELTEMMPLAVLLIAGVNVAE